jgi:hypothetical protein
LFAHARSLALGGMGALGESSLRLPLLSMEVMYSKRTSSTLRSDEDFADAVSTFRTSRNAWSTEAEEVEGFSAPGSQIGW